MAFSEAFCVSDGRRTASVIGPTGKRILKKNAGQANKLFTRTGTPTPDNSFAQAGEPMMKSSKML
jgi:hypothetical protein